jgi:hypothetical protein
MTNGGAEALDLRGLDGSNPLGFLAALGTLRLVDAPELPARLSWHRAHGAWTARLWIAAPAPSEGALAERFAGRLRASAGHPAFEQNWDDLSVHPDEFRRFADAAQETSRRDREWADFAAAFGCEATVEATGGEPTIQDTAFRTMRGAGHQHFLKTMRHVLGEVTAEQVRKTLFEPWTYDDPLEKSSLRWDPNDDVRYALRWRNPSGDPERKKRGSMLGANALAIHALPLFPTAPARRRLATTGFSRFGRDTVWTWPIWEPPASLSVVRSLLGLPDLQQRWLDPATRSALARRGVSEIYRSRRITVGKVRNFTPGEPAPDRHRLPAPRPSPP